MVTKQTGVVFIVSPTFFRYIVLGSVHQRTKEYIQDCYTLSFDNRSIISTDRIVNLSGIIEFIRSCHIKNRVDHCYIYWILESPLIETKIMTSHDFYADTYQLKYVEYVRDTWRYLDLIYQPLLLQLRLLSHASAGYCASPLSSFFLLSFLCNNSSIGSKVFTGNVAQMRAAMDELFSLSYLRKIMPYQQNLAHQNCYDYILIHALHTYLWNYNG